MASKKEKKPATSSSKRPPIVAVLGHVDHGKTSLLDYIRKTRVVEREAGGITQGIGAYQIDVSPTKITFIGTPGHEAFSKMRSRGAVVADIAILVVAADDSVKPQTEESVKYIKEAGTPMIVAINKTDLPAADPEKVKKDLLRVGVACEGYGGDTVAVNISAKTGKGIDELLEMIGLVADMQGLMSNPQGDLEGVVVESKLDKRSGILTTIIVKNGTLRNREIIKAGNVQGKVKALLDEFGKRVDQVLPSSPVEILGFTKLVPVGSVVTRVGEHASTKVLLETNSTSDTHKKKGILKLIVKSSSNGSLESVLEGLPVGIEVIRSGVGDVNRDDIEFAIVSKAAVIGFEVDADSAVTQLAADQKIILRTYKIIYQLIEEVEDVIKELTSVPEEVATGVAKVLAKFSIGDVNVAGVRVEQGILRLKDMVKIEHEGKISRGKIVSIKQQKVEVNEAKQGGEYGIGVSSELDFIKGDVIIAYNIQ